MTELNDLARVEPVGVPSELRFPVAYSHGGFAQLRHSIAYPDANPLGPIPVPAEYEVAIVPEVFSSVVVELEVELEPV